MSELIQTIYDDLLTTQANFGSEFIYEENGDDLVAVALDTDGNETARYRVGILLEKL